MSKYMKPAVNGFIGSFKLALALVLALVAVSSAFIHGGTDAVNDVIRSISNK